MGILSENLHNLLFAIISKIPLVEAPDAEHYILADDCNIIVSSLREIDQTIEGFVGDLISQGIVSSEYLSEQLALRINRNGDVMDAPLIVPVASLVSPSLGIGETGSGLTGTDGTDLVLVLGGLPKLSFLADGSMRFANGYVLFPPGTQAAPSLAFNAGLGLYRLSMQSIGIAVNGETRHLLGATCYFGGNTRTDGLEVIDPIGGNPGALLKRVANYKAALRYPNDLADASLRVAELEAASIKIDGMPQVFSAGLDIGTTGVRALVTFSDITKEFVWQDTQIRWPNVISGVAAFNGQTVTYTENFAGAMQQSTLSADAARNPTFGLGTTQVPPQTAGMLPVLRGQAGQPAQARFNVSSAGSNPPGTIIPVDVIGYFRPKGGI